MNPDPLEELMAEMSEAWWSELGVAMASDGSSKEKLDRIPVSTQHQAAWLRANRDRLLKALDVIEMVPYEEDDTW